MCGRALKNYDNYLQKLEIYAKAINIKIEYREYPNDGAYYPTRKVIKLDDSMSDSEEIATFLHELGHCMDETFNDTPQSLQNAYINIYENKATELQKEMVVECEKRAWKNGREIAKLIHIRLGAWYDECEKRSINTYRKEDVK